MLTVGCKNSLPCDGKFILPRTLESKEGVAEIIDQSSKAKTLHVRRDDDGQWIVFFSYNGQKFMYSFAQLGILSHYGRVELGDDMNYNCDEHFDDREFRFLIEKIIERNVRPSI